MDASSSTSMGPRPVDDPSAKDIVTKYLTQHEPVFRTLGHLREKVTNCYERPELEELVTNLVYKGWENPRGDSHFIRQRQQADHADQQSQAHFFDMMCKIGDEMQIATKVFSPPSQVSHQKINVLDLCMAPGGYSASALKYNPGSVVRGITLPEDQGGHRMLVKAPPGCRMHVKDLDITMLATEFGVTDIPPNHPEGDKFSTTRLFAQENFDLVFCGGQVLRNHPKPKHCEPREHTRLIVSQLIFALQRIKTGGRLVVLLHKADAWSSIQLILQIDRFASVLLFKPRAAHKVRSSFYLIATEVRPESDTAKKAVKKWKEIWWRATFGGEEGTGEAESSEPGFVKNVLDEFGKWLIDYARPVWQLQVEALRETEFAR
ncbi:hypothetical protein MMC14_008836 [Varicellaria rhodocarpa]|nr:hypothetical protein [Varicellaria rhodocarpa]